MEQRILGTELKVSAVGLGCMGFTHAYGCPTEKSVAIRHIREAADMGYSYFDTAEVYAFTHADGVTEYNEELVGAALKDIRQQVIISSKCGVILEKGTGVPLPDGSRQSIRRSLEGSLKRLGVDCIDLYFQHRMDPNTPPEDVAATMAELIREGKIRYWGVSEATEEYIRRAHAVCPITAIQNRYSMMARHYEALFPVLEELHIGFVAYSPMANGFLSGKYDQSSHFESQVDYRSRMPQFTAEAVEKNQQLLQLLHRLATSKGATPAQISLAWMLNKKPYIVPIPGSRKLERMEENAGAAAIKMSPEEIAAVDKALAEIPMSKVFGGTTK